MRIEDSAGTFYRGYLPHIRELGASYHVRFSVLPCREMLSADWMCLIVEQSLLFGHKRTYLLHGYVIMPTHVHAVVQPLPKHLKCETNTSYQNFHRLEDVVGRVKSYSSRLINTRAGRSGSYWQDEYYDRMIRDDKDLDNVIDYIHQNPVRWHLAETPEQYRWSSLRTIYSGRAEYAEWFIL